MIYGRQEAAIKMRESRDVWKYNIKHVTYSLGVLSLLLLP